LAALSVVGWRQPLNGGETMIGRDCLTVYEANRRIPDEVVGCSGSGTSCLVSVICRAMLKFFEIEARFPNGPQELPAVAVTFAET
jgi:hypothetical protein